MRLFVDNERFVCVGYSFIDDCLPVENLQV